MNPLDDPRIAPHLQRLADVAFAHLLLEASICGILVLEGFPFDMLDEDIADRFKAAIAGALVDVLPSVQGA